MARVVKDVGVGQQDQFGVVSFSHTLRDRPQLATPAQWAGLAIQYYQARIVDSARDAASAIGAAIIDQDDAGRADVALDQEGAEGIGDRMRLVAGRDDDGDGRGYCGTGWRQLRFRMPET